MRYSNILRYSSGVAKPTVSGQLMVVAPASMAAWTTSARKSSSVREASSGENSTSLVYSRASFTFSTLMRMISSLALLELELAMDLGGGAEDVDARRWACLTASPARRTSFSVQRARPAIVHWVISAAMAETESKSPWEVMGKPASMISTPSCSRARAISSFSFRFMEAPGDCSPSRRVVSKIRMWLESAG